MKKTLIPYAVAAVGCMAFSSLEARAGLLVEQWQTPTGVYNGLAGVDAVIAGGAADISSVWDVIDFTDDPSGFAGDIPGSVPWPAAAAVGATGTGHELNDFFGARVSGFINISVADTYTFKTYADDGVRLKIGGTTVISDDTYHPESIYTGAIALTPGIYAIDLIFFEGGGEASLEFQVKQGDGAYGHVGGVGGPPTTAAVPDAGSSLTLMGLASTGLMFLRRRNTSR